VQRRQEKTQAADHENLHSDSKSKRQKVKHREKKSDEKMFPAGREMAGNQLQNDGKRTNRRKRKDVKSRVQ
jgi:hypothetical protein